MLKLNDELKDRISYILIAIIILINLVPLLISSDFILTGLIQASLLGLLAGLYFLTAEKKDLFFVSLGLFALTSLLLLLIPTFAGGLANTAPQATVELFIKILFSLPFISSTIAIGVLAYKHSIQFKAFEMIEWLLVLFLLIYVSKNFVHTEFDVYYSFALSFLIATLMYNNNMWLRYEQTQKDLLVFLLVLTFVDVIRVSAKFITF